MNKGYVKLAVAGLSIGLAMALSASLAAHRTTQSLIEGAENGFGINGMYVSDGASGPSMAILAGDDMEWQLVNNSGVTIEGNITATSDPNAFNLISDDGAPCGSVRLAYASTDGTDGILYVSHDTGDFKLRKTNRVPAFIED